MRPISRVRSRLADRLAFWWTYRLLRSLLYLAPRPIWWLPSTALAALRLPFDVEASHLADYLTVALQLPPSRSARLILRWSLCHQYEIDRLLTLQSERLTADRLLPHVRFDGALPSDGAILVTPHHVGMRPGLTALAATGVRLGGAMIDPGDSAAFRELDPATRAYYVHLRPLRERMYGRDTFQRHEIGRNGLRLLREGGYLVLQGDGFSLDWHRGSLLGREVPIPTGPVWFAERSGKPVVPYMAIPHGKGWRLWFGTPIPAAGVTHEVITRALEECLHRAPSSWERTLAVAWSNAPTRLRDHVGGMSHSRFDASPSACIVAPLRIEAIVENLARQRPDHSALVFGERIWTFAALWREVNRRAAMLIEDGIGPGDVIFTAEPVTDDVAITFLACCRADATLLYLSPSLTVGEMAPLVESTCPKLTLTSDGRPSAASPSLHALPLNLPGAPGRAAYREAEQRSTSGTAESVASIQTTSGTTGGVAKLVCMPHGMVTWRSSTPSWWETEDAVYMIPRPTLFAVRGFCEMLATGGTVVLSDATRANQLEREMVVSGVTVLWSVPAIVQMLTAQRSPPPDGLRLRIVRTSAAPLPTAVRQAAAQRYGTSVIHEYASTEGGSITTAPPEGAPADSIGMPYPGIATRIVDEHGVDVPVGEVGELVVRSPGLMVGYLNDPAFTNEVLRDGWLWTGDLAWCDTDGFLYLAGRRLLRINFRGFKVAPEEVEAVLEQHPDVREAAVTAYPGRYGEIVRAAIVPRCERPRVRDLRRHCRDQLASYKVPRRWEFHERLPRSPLGKVLRHKL